MSGGHFNYAYLKATNASDAIEALETFHQMERELRIVGKHEVADEIYRFTLEIETAKRHIEVAGQRLEDLLHDIEWAFSADYAMEDIDEAHRRLLNGGKDA